MDVPLGRTAGNALEVIESVEVLEGGGPADVIELTVALAREMLDLVGIDDVDPAAVLAEGRALETWEQMVRAQGGDPHAPLPRAGEIEIVPAPYTGTRSNLDAMSVGEAGWRLGGGRARRGEDPS